MVTSTLFFFISCIGFIESAREGKERIRMATSLFQVFDDHYYAALSNQDQCPSLQQQAAVFLGSTIPVSSRSCEMMLQNDLKDNFICFCSTSPFYNLQEPTAEWIFSSSFVQYSAIRAIFILTVGRIYNLYALEVPNIQQANDCAKVASYLNAFRAIAFEDRMSEIGKIYEFAADNLSERSAKGRLDEQKSKGYYASNMLTQRNNFFKLDDLLDRLTNIIEINGSQQVFSLPCKGKPVDKDNSQFPPLQMYLDFYINANMNADKTSCSFEPIKDKYTRNYGVDNSHFVRNEGYREYYYKEAWEDIFHIFYHQFFHMVNYFNNVLYDEEPNIISNGAFEPFIPPINESSKVWDKAHELWEIIDTKYNVDNRSKVIKILRGILTANAPDDVLIKPEKIQLTYKNSKGLDFSIDFKNN